MSQTFTHTGALHPITGDEHCVNESGQEFWDRNGVIACSATQHDSIESIREAIRIGAEFLPQLLDRDGHPNVYSAVSEPYIGSVVVASWAGAAWIVRRDGSVFRSQSRFEIDTNYNLYEVK